MAAIEHMYDSSMDMTTAAQADVDRKARGAFFTSPAIANFLSRWAIHGNRDAHVLDPTSGEGVFLVAAAQELCRLGTVENKLSEQVNGIDLHEGSVTEARRLLDEMGLDANLIVSDFFELAPPGALFSSVGPFDAIIGNPPFVRYQQHIGEARRMSTSAALRQGVRLSGLASSWAALLVHAAGFLRSDGRLAMVLPAELLTVGYAEPVRDWLRRRFAAVKLVFFERHQFADAQENVVLLLAQGSGGCDAFSLYYVNDGEDLRHIQPFDEFAVKLSEGGKWTDLILSIRERQTFKDILNDHFVALGDYGQPELGTVTGANSFFTLSDAKRRELGLTADRQVIPVCPPGSRHLHGMTFTRADWEELRDAGEAVWLLHPSPTDRTTSLRRYVSVGENQGVSEAYKCRIRTPWWRPPVVAEPDLFFTYMSHRYPRLVNNAASVTFLNSMHGVRLRAGMKFARQSLPFIAMNSVSMLGAELFGRSYGGGILKMEPREAARLPVPRTAELSAAWSVLKSNRAELEQALRNGDWSSVVTRVDDVLLRHVMGISDTELEAVTTALATLRKRRMSRSSSSTARSRG